MTPDVYGPDGVPLDGPRTTAAEQAETLTGIGRWYGRRADYTVARDWAMYRDAAAYEGERYSEAIRGARVMRSAEFAKGVTESRFSNHRVSYAAWSWEREQGLPEGWIARG